MYLTLNRAKSFAIASTRVFSDSLNSRKLDGGLLFIKSEHACVLGWSKVGANSCIS